jgi:hypothetical protein
MRRALEQPILIDIPNRHDPDGAKVPLSTGQLQQVSPARNAESSTVVAELRRFRYPSVTDLRKSFEQGQGKPDVGSTPTTPRRVLHPDSLLCTPHRSDGTPSHIRKPDHIANYDGSSLSSPARIKRCTILRSSPVHPLLRPSQPSISTSLPKAEAARAFTRLTPADAMSELARLHRALEQERQKNMMLMASIRGQEGVENTLNGHTEPSDTPAILPVHNDQLPVGTPIPVLQEVRESVHRLHAAKAVAKPKKLKKKLPVHQESPLKDRINLFEHLGQSASSVTTSTSSRAWSYDAEINHRLGFTHDANGNPYGSRGSRRAMGLWRMLSGSLGKSQKLSEASPEQSKATAPRAGAVARLPRGLVASSQCLPNVTPFSMTSLAKDGDFNDPLRVPMQMGQVDGPHTDSPHEAIRPARSPRASNAKAGQRESHVQEQVLPPPLPPKEPFELAAEDAFNKKNVPCQGQSGAKSTNKRSLRSRVPSSWSRATKPFNGTAASPIISGVTDAATSSAQLPIASMRSLVASSTGRSSGKRPSLKSSWRWAAAWRNPSSSSGTGSTESTFATAQTVQWQLDGGSVEPRLEVGRSFSSRIHPGAATVVEEGGSKRLGGGSSQVGKEDDKLVVANAQCGLMQPRPMRLSELKRLVSLCKEGRAGVRR